METTPLIPPQVERLDDVPLLLGQMQKMGLPALLDEHFPLHGNWSGSSVGHIVCVWLAHILTEQDHCLNHVRPWALERLGSLRQLLFSSLSEYDFTDDRLAALLSFLSIPECWEAFEAALGSRLVRLYDLETLVMRHDSSTTFSFRPEGEEGALLRLGHSKDHRPDQPQLKLMLSSLDELGMPLATTVWPGNSADDPLYRPALERVCHLFPQRCLLHVGDCKFGSLENRMAVVAAGHHYLCPLSEKQFSAQARQEAIAFVRQQPTSLQEIQRSNSPGEEVLIAQGYCWQRQQTGSLLEQFLCWQERLLLVRSLRQAQAAERHLQRRLQRALEDLQALNRQGRGRRRPKSRAELEQWITQRLETHDLTSLIRVQVEDQPAVSLKRCWDFHLTAQVAPQALQERLFTLGWQVYATSAPAEGLSLEQAVNTYRQEYLLENTSGD